MYLQRVYVQNLNILYSKSFACLENVNIFLSCKGMMVAALEPVWQGKTNKPYSQYVWASQVTTS